MCRLAIRSIPAEPGTATREQPRRLTRREHEILELGNFTQHYYDSRGVARVYQMTLDGQAWKLWRQAPGFWQRYNGVITEDDSTIIGAWAASADGQEWKHDFGLTYITTR